MTFVLLFLGLLLLGIVLILVGVVLLIVLKKKLAGFIVLGAGLLATLISVLAFLSLVITTRTMG